MNTDAATYRLFVKKARATVEKCHMLAHGDRVIAGISGGPDSTALLVFLMEIREAFSIDIAVAHLNHMLRAGAADRDELFVRQLSAEFRLPFFSEKRDVAAFAEENRLSVEDAARKIRYAFLRDLAARHGYSKIALGHQRDDDAELVLMNIIRGAGARGLSGIPPVRDNLVVRPLIEIAKNDIEAFLQSAGRDWVTDASNADNSFLRNSVRNRLIPFLAENYNPAITQTLNRLSRITRDEDQWMEREALTVLDAALLSKEPFLVTLATEKLKTCHAALRRRVERSALKTVKGDLKRISLKHIEDIDALVLSAVPGKSLDLPDQIRVYTENGKICVKKESVPLRQLDRGGGRKRRR